jgi:hypothetical protein
VPLSHTSAASSAVPGMIRNRGPWKSIDDLEVAVAEYIDWINHREDN